MTEVKKEEGKPLYVTLYEALRGEIVSGRFSPGSRLPSKRTLASETGVSLVTAEHALELLEEEGYLYAKERSGHYVSFAEGRFFNAPREAPPAPRGHLPGTGSDFPFSVMAKAMRGVISDYGEDILVKSPNSGLPELKKAIADYLARSRRMDVAPEQLVIGSGAEYLYSLLALFLGREKVYAIENPSYEKIEAVYTSLGIAPRLLKLGEHGIESEALEGCDAEVLHITPYRSYPSGVSADAAKREEYLRWAKEGRYIVEDDFESEFTPASRPERTLFSASRLGNVIYVNTFSKTVALALRVVYAVIPPGLLPRFKEAVGFYSCTVPTFEQLVIARLLVNGSFERHLNKTRRRLKKDLTSQV